MAVNKVSVDLPAELFDVEANVALMHQVVNARLLRHVRELTRPKLALKYPVVDANRFVKGTGRARQGSIRTTDDRWWNCTRSSITRLLAAYP